MAIEHLRRVDAISLKIVIVAVIVIAFSSAVKAIDGTMAGYALVGMVLVLAVIRFILFCIMDK